MDNDFIKTPDGNYGRTPVMRVYLDDGVSRSSQPLSPKTFGIDPEANDFILFPIFEVFMPINQVIQSFAGRIPFIHTKWDVMLYSAFPI